LVISCLFSLSFAQGINTRANKDDWEEINFEFNSAVLVDGFPSLLRMAELLQKNGEYKVRVEGHTDKIGSGAYNDKLGLARGNAVREFLLKYGARPNQIEVTTRGKTAPKVPGGKEVLEKTDEARWMNRRVILTVTDGQGRVVGAGGPGDAIRAMEPAPQKPQRDCCDEILKRLDRLDEIAKALRDLQDQNAALRNEIASMKQQHDQMASQIKQPPPVAPAPTPPPPPPPPRESPFQLLGLNAGPDSNGGATFSGRGRFFQPFGRFAIQAQGEYLRFSTQREGQADIGLIDRLSPRFQAGLFASFKHVTLRGNQSGGTLGQAALTLDYIFRHGRLGVFGTKGFLDNALINRQNATLADGTLMRNLFVERYLKIVDQAGASATLPFVGKSYIEANAGYLKSFGYGDRFGGTVRLIFPLNDKIAITAEGGVNETMLGRGNTGRAVFGVQFGNLQRPKEYFGIERPVPTDVPRIRYELIERLVRTGNDAPVADAGPDQIGVQAGTIQLDGSRSYDPDNDPITFQWIQEAGPLVTLSGALTSRPSFTAAAGQNYVFRLTVRDDKGATGAARVRVSTATAERVQILFFIANPATIRAGEPSQLSWRVLNADTVDITGLGRVAASGSSNVLPAESTTYRLTARNAISEENAQVTVVVQRPDARVISCFAVPTNIVAGETSTINYLTENADTVTINGRSVPRSGSITVTPTETTTYTVTAANAFGSSSCAATVTVGTGQVPRIIRFSAIPAAIDSGQSSTLFWVVENATRVNITTIGDVNLSGTQDVTPAATTTYTLTASNQFGTATAGATVTVRVVPPPRITSFTATPATSPGPQVRVILNCQATGAVSIMVADALFNGGNGSFPVFPTRDTTYTCIATNSIGQTDRATLTVPVTQTPGPTGLGPVVIIRGAPVILTHRPTVVLDGSQSFSPSGFTPLTFQWTIRYGTAQILSPTASITTANFTDAGDYVFDLTVTDSRGNRSTGSVTVKVLDP
jgi:hypothetical protein